MRSAERTCAFSGICANESLSLKLIGSTLQNTPRVGPPTRFRTRPKITPTTEAATARSAQNHWPRKNSTSCRSENDFARAFATYRLETNQMLLATSSSGRSCSKARRLSTGEPPRRSDSRPRQSAGSMTRRPRLRRAPHLDHRHCLIFPCTCTSPIGRPMNPVPASSNVLRSTRSRTLKYRVSPSDAMPGSPCRP